MKHTEKVNMQASALFVIALVIMVGTYIVIMAGIECFENFLSVIIDASNYLVKM